jgi:Protein of unknown function (DUF3352)
MSAESGAGQAAWTICGSCGQPLTAGALWCGSCGRPIASAAYSGGKVPEFPTAVGLGDTPTVPQVPQPGAGAWLAPNPPMPGGLWPQGGPPEPSLPGAEVDWGSSSATAPMGMAALATAPTARPVSGRGRRQAIIASVAATCVVALLAGTVYWLFAAVLNPASQTETARYLPDNTVYYTSIDLVAAAVNSHHISTSDLGKNPGTGDALKSALGLDWQHDVLPWLGRSISVGVFPMQIVVGGGDASQSPVAAVLLLQSHDDAAAQRAVQKALDFQQQKGATFSASTYGGFAVHTAGGGGTGAGAIATGSGLVLIANDTAAAHAVIDRANGHGATLASSGDFLRAVSDLPGNRFGTIYVNLRAVTSLLGPASATLQVPFIDTYPTAGGALIWTAPGLRWQITFKAAHSGALEDTVTGDTTGLAAMVPGTALLYSGVANLGALIQNVAHITQVGTTTGTPTVDPLQAPLGIATTDPAVRQPGAVVMLPAGRGSAGAGALLLREPDAATASALVAQLAAHSHWTAKATTVDGVSATALYASAVSVNPLLLPASPVISPSASSSPTLQLVAVAAMVNGALVLATSPAALTAIVETTRGTVPSLAQATRFQHLTAQAPGGAAATLYVDLSQLQALTASLIGSGTTPSGTPQPAQSVTAALITLVWDDQKLQTTYDLQLGN